MSSINITIGVLILQNDSTAHEGIATWITVWYNICIVIVY